jgi:hypothetical protein
MTTLTGTIDGVVGVDTHRDTLAAAATNTVGGLLAQTSSARTRPATVACSPSLRCRCPVGAAGR